MANELNVGSPSGQTIYALIWKVSNTTIWNGSSFETFAVASLGSYDIPLTGASNRDYYSADFPTSITAGTYFIQYYVQSGGSPDAGDFKLPSDEEFYWNGSSVDSSPSSDYLTTLANVKLYLHITDTDNDSLLTKLLGAASRKIEKFLDTLVLSGSYTEYISGTGTQFLTTANRWITSVSRVAMTPEVVLEIQNTSAFSSIQRAHVKLEDGTLSLVRTASGVDATNTITVASYATLALLEAAIEAVGNGWSATVTSGYENFPSADISSNFYGSAVDGDIAELEAYVDELTWQRRNDEWGIIYSPSGFRKGFQNIECKYAAGYAAGAVPDDIQQACCALVAALYGATLRGGGSLKSEKIGDWSYTNFDPDKLVLGSIKNISREAYELLAPMRRIGML